MKRNILILSAFLIVLFTSSALYAQVADNQSESVYEVGELVEAADYRGVWYRSKITDVDNEKYLVHFFGWSDSWDEWVTAERIRYADNDEFGREVEVSQNGRWYQAVIVDERYNREHLVLYTDDDGEAKEEWVLNDRLREINSRGYSRRDGRLVEVLYGDKWVKAQILKRRPGEVYVHYVGESDIWNKWISTDKVRRIR